MNAVLEWISPHKSTINDMISAVSRKGAEEDTYPQVWNQGPDLLRRDQYELARQSRYWGRGCTIPDREESM